MHSGLFRPRPNSVRGYNEGEISNGEALPLTLSAASAFIKAFVSVVYVSFKPALFVNFRGRASSPAPLQRKFPPGSFPFRRTRPWIEAGSETGGRRRNGKQRARSRRRRNLRNSHAVVEILLLNIKTRDFALKCKAFCGRTERTFPVKIFF